MLLLGIPIPSAATDDDDADLAELKLPQKEERPFTYEIKVVHDESIARSKDSGKRLWSEKGQNHTITPKSDGAGVMISAFCSPHFGWLAYSDEAWQQALLQHPEWATDEEQHRNAYQLFEYGANKKGYWKAPHFIRQVDRSIDIFNATYPGARAVYYIDCSSNHNAYAPDALVASKMNVLPGGKQPLMRDGYYYKDGVKVVQAMHTNGLAKGLRAVLEERTLFKEGMHHEDMVNVLSEQEDFKSQKPMVQEWIERRGHVCIFWPKYHPELSMIEMCWSSWKRILRSHCDYTLQGLRVNVRKALHAIGIKEMRAYERHCQRYIAAYREGHTGYTVIAALKKYKSHRRINTNDDTKAAKDI